MSTRIKVLLIVIAVVCFAVALSYPIMFKLDEASNEENTARLAALREAGRRSTETVAPKPSNDDLMTGTPDDHHTVNTTNDDKAADVMGDNDTADTTDDGLAPAPSGNQTARPPEETPSLAYTPSPSPSPSPTPDRRQRTGALAYPEKERVVFDEANILPEFREMYELNHDLVGWLTIPGTVVDYPVVRSEDQEYYLTHDFFGEKSKTGQIILDERCDPYTPSYNLVISGHNLYNDTMFSTLIKFRSKNYWKERKTLTFDVLTERRSYVIFAAFFSGDYDVDEAGFRYNADIQYRLDAEKWLEEIRKNQVYDTGIDAAFGDEFLTLTTCNHYYRKNGRFVLVCRRIREGEVF